MVMVLWTMVNWRQGILPLPFQAFFVRFSQYHISKFALTGDRGGVVEILEVCWLAAPLLCPDVLGEDRWRLLLQLDELHLGRVTFVFHLSRPPVSSVHEIVELWHLVHLLHLFDVRSFSFLCNRLFRQPVTEGFEWGWICLESARCRELSLPLLQFEMNK